MRKQLLSDPFRNNSAICAFVLIVLLMILIAGCSNSPSNDDSPLPGEPKEESSPIEGTDKTIYGFANKCFTVLSQNNGNFIKTSGLNYSASISDEAKAEAFFMKPSDLGIYIFQDSTGRYLDAADGTSIISSSEPRVSSEWELKGIESGVFALKSVSAQKWLSSDETGKLLLSDVLDSSCNFIIELGKECSTFPESEVNAQVEMANTPVGEKIVGFADPHVHMTGNEGFGGKVVWGKMFHPLGITKALPDCEELHGKNGSKDIVESVANGTTGHDTSGWPDFKYWPGPDSPTHQMVYYKWLERSWAGGLRLMVNFTVNNEVLCQIAGQMPGYTCADMDTVDRQLAHIKQMERYIDAQCGGPGKGWFRIVYSPEEAREVISRGKLAVVLGIEVATIFNIRTDIDEIKSDEARESEIENAKEIIKTQLDYYYSLGVRSIFPIHGFNNAFGGTAMFVPAIYNLGNRIRNGEYFKPCECPTHEEYPDLLSPTEVYTYKELSITYPEGSNPFVVALCKLLGIALPVYPEYPQGSGYCNSRGLTELGKFFITEMIHRKMIVEIDHMSSRMINGYIDPETGKNDGVLEIVESYNYPIVSSHAAVVEGKGDEASKSIDQIRRIHRLGGIVAPILIQGDEGIRNKYIDGPYCKISSRGWANVYKYICDVIEKDGDFVGVPLSTDANGFATEPSPRFGEKACSGTGEQQNEAPKVAYPFAPFAGEGVIDNLRTGNRVFDINYDGLANYGMLPDFIQEVKNVGLTDKDLAPLFNSAEAYIRMWEKIESRP
jgi:microsomal dipeptidase-like Zn-dependent dipeptidase